MKKMMPNHWILVPGVIVDDIVRANLHFDGTLVETALRQYLVNILRSRKYREDRSNDPEWLERRKAQWVKYNTKRRKRTKREIIISTMKPEEKNIVSTLSKEDRLSAIKKRAEDEVKETKASRTTSRTPR